MKKKLIIVLFLGTINLFAQQQPDSLLVEQIPAIQQQITKQQDEITQLNLKVSKMQNDSLLLKKIESIQLSLENQQQEIKHLSSELSSLVSLTNQQRLALRNLDKKYDSLLTRTESQKGLIESNTTNINAIASDLGTQIQETGQKADNQIAQLDSSVEKNRLYWIIATLATLLLGGLVYWLLGKRIKSSKTDVETQIRNTKASLEEESVKLDNKLVEVLETQLKLQQETAKSQPVASNEKADHSLALKVADEIIRIQKNLGRMDESTKGLKQLNSSVQRIQDNFASNGYELVDMLGKEYHEGMKVTANFIPSEDIETGKEIITRIIKPQVNFKGAMIQSAQIEVSIGE